MYARAYATVLRLSVVCTACIDCGVARARAKVTIDSLVVGLYEKSIGTKSKMTLTFV